MYQETIEFNMFKEAHVFLQWFRFKYKHLIQESELKNKLLEGLEMGIDPDNKSLFLEMIKSHSIWKEASKSIEDGSPDTSI